MKPPGCKVVISFHTLPAGIHNWDLCRKHRIEFDTVDSNSIICVRIDNSDGVEVLQVGYINVTLFDSEGAVFGVREQSGTEYVRINMFGRGDVDSGNLSLFSPCYSSFAKQ